MTVACRVSAAFQELPVVWLLVVVLTYGLGGCGDGNGDVDDAGESPSTDMNTLEDAGPPLEDFLRASCTRLSDGSYVDNCERLSSVPLAPQTDSPPRPDVDDGRIRRARCGPAGEWLVLVPAEETPPELGELEVERESAHCVSEAVARERGWI